MTWGRKAVEAVAVLKWDNWAAVAEGNISKRRFQPEFDLLGHPGKLSQHRSFCSSGRVPRGQVPESPAGAARTRRAGIHPQDGSGTRGCSCRK